MLILGTVTYGWGTVAGSAALLIIMIGAIMTAIGFARLGYHLVKLGSVKEAA